MHHCPNPNVASADDLEKPHHKRLVRRGVHIVELRLAYRSVYGARNVGVVTGKPREYLRLAVGIVSSRPDVVFRGGLPDGALDEPLVFTIDAAAVAAPVVTDAPHPLAAERIVEERGTVAYLSARVNRHPMASVGRDELPASHRASRRRNEKPPVGVWISGGIIWPDAECINRQPRQQYVIAIRPDTRTLPLEAISGLRQRQRAVPARQIPHPEASARRIPPYAAAWHATSWRAHGAVWRTFILVKLGFRLRPHHRVADVFDGLVEFSHDAR